MEEKLTLMLVEDDPQAVSPPGGGDGGGEGIPAVVDQRHCQAQIVVPHHTVPLIHPDGDPDAAGGIVAAPGVFPVVFGEMGMEILQNIVK